MLSGSKIAYIAISVLMVSGIFALTFVHPFGESWVVGLGLIGIAIAGIVVTVRYKTKEI